MIRTVIVLSLLCVALSFSTCTYRDKFIAADLKIETQNDAIKAQKEEAARQLVSLTRERDAKQAELNRRAAEQEKKDETAKSEIDRLRGDLVRAGVRVRLSAGSCRPSSGGAQSEATRPADDRSGDAGPQTGLLPEENTRRLAGVIAEVETMSAAYASCRSSLIPSKDHN